MLRGMCWGHWIFQLPIIPMPIIRTRKSLLEGRTPRSGGRCVVALFLVALSLSGCDANNAQGDFRIAAGAVPSGIFRTVDGMTPLNGEHDPDDWRTAPIYATSGFRVNRRASPNPVQISGSGTVTIEVVTDARIPGGLQLVARDGLGGRTVLTPFIDTPQGFTIFTFFASEILGAEAGDLWRLVLFDNRGEPVTYGDLKIEQ